MENQTKVLRKRVRPRSCATRFVRLRQLLCFKEVEEQIKAGLPVSQVAEYIQREKGESLDITRDGLMHMLTNYREQLAKNEIIKNRLPAKVEEWVAQSKKAVDEITELGNLFRLQMERIQLGVKGEKLMKKLEKQLGQEVYYAMKILQSSAAIKVDFGLAGNGVGNREELPAAGINVNVLNLDFAKKYGSDAVQRVISDPAARRRVLSLVERISQLQTSKQKVIVEKENEQSGIIEVELSKAG